MSTKWKSFYKIFVPSLLCRRNFRHPKVKKYISPKCWPYNIQVTKVIPVFTGMILSSALITNKDVSSDDISITDVEDNVAHLLTLARIALEKGDTERAEAILELGLKICEEHKLYIALPYMYDILVTVAFAENNVTKAENLLVDVIEKLAQVGFPETDHYIIDFKLRLARVYSTYKENELAEIGFRTCLDTQKEKLNQGDLTARTGMLYVNALFWFAVHKVRNEHYGEAKEMLMSAHEYANKIKGLSPYQEMIIQYTLADINAELEDYSLALQNITNAILLGKGISSTDLPRCYIKLAKVYAKMDAKEKAKESAIEGLKLAKLFNNTDMIKEAQSVLDKL